MYFWQNSNDNEFIFIADSSANEGTWTLQIVGTDNKDANVKAVTFTLGLTVTSLPGDFVMSLDKYTYPSPPNQPLTLLRGQISPPITVTIQRFNNDRCDIAIVVLPGMGGRLALDGSSSVHVDGVSRAGYLLPISESSWTFNLRADPSCLLGNDVITVDLYAVDPNNNSIWVGGNRIEKFDEIYVTVAQTQKFIIVANLSPSIMNLREHATLDVTVLRNDKFTDPVTVSLSDVPKFIDQQPQSPKTILGVGESILYDLFTTPNAAYKDKTQLTISGSSGTDLPETTVTDLSILPREGTFNEAPTWPPTKYSSAYFNDMTSLDGSWCAEFDYDSFSNITVTFCPTDSRDPSLGKCSTDDIKFPDDGIGGVGFSWDWNCAVVLCSKLIPNHFTYGILWLNNTNPTLGPIATWGSNFSSSIKPMFQFSRDGRLCMVIYMENQVPHNGEYHWLMWKIFTTQRAAVVLQEGYIKDTSNPPTAEVKNDNGKFYINISDKTQIEYDYSP